MDATSSLRPLASRQMWKRFQCRLGVRQSQLNPLQWKRHGADLCLHPALKMPVRQVRQKREFARGGGCICPHHRQCLQCPHPVELQVGKSLRQFEGLVS